MEFILTFLLFVFIFGWVVSRLFPLILSWYVKRKMKNGGTPFGNFGGVYTNFYGNGANGAQMGDREDEVKRSKAQEGKVTVTKLEEKEKVIEKDMGEYIEFEEEK